MLSRSYYLRTLFPKMKILAIFLLVFFIFQPIAYSYPKDLLKECILGAKRSPLLVGVPAVEVENWCNCTLELIVDKGKGDLDSANFCGQKYFK